MIQRPCLGKVLEMPKVIWVSALIGLALGVATGAGFGIAGSFQSGPALGLAGGAFAAVLFSVLGLLLGIGVGSILHAPVWATTGALLCVPIAYFLGLLLAPTASDVAEGTSAHWTMGVGVFQLLAPFAAFWGAILRDWRQTGRQHWLT